MKVPFAARPCGACAANLIWPLAPLPPMRLLSVVVLSALLCVPMATAAEDKPADRLKVLEDARGDHVMSAGGQPTPVSGGDAADLLSLDVTELERSLVFRLSVAALAASETPYTQDAFYRIDFKARGAGYCIFSYFDAASVQASASLAAEDSGSGFCRGREEVAVTVDAAAGVLSFDIPRSMLPGSDGAPLMRDDAVSEFAVFAETIGDALARGYTLGTARGDDRMPDTGTGSTVMPVRLGGSQNGTLRASIPDPVRVSNGEATTYLYVVKVTNKADHPDTVEVRAGTAPPQWTLTFPQQEVRLEEGAEAEVPILVTVPFNHEHGTYMATNVTFQSRSDPLSHATMELGVRYTKVPQPAGHHDTVYWHSGGGRPFINTLENDTIPEGEGGAAPQGWTCGFGGADSGRGRFVPLVPDLDLGLDVDMTRWGNATVIVQSEVPVLGTLRVGGYFVAWYGDDQPSPCVQEAPPEAIAVLERSEPLRLDANTPVTLTLPVKPLPYGDRLERKPDIHMGLIVAFYQEQGSFVTGIVPYPEVQDGTTFQLPLSEYHDKVDQYFSTLSGVDLYAVGGQQLKVNPGETVLFEVKAEMLGTQAADFRLEVSGLNTEWARVIGGTQVRLEPGNPSTITVAVEAPEGATAGTVADLTLHAVKADDANVRSLIRLLATVETAEDLPDEAPQAEEIAKQAQKSTPALPVLLGLLVFALVAVRRRKA